MAGWHNLRNVVEQEFVQALEEGREVAGVEALRAGFEAAGEDEGKLRELMLRIRAVPIRGDFGFVEPSDLEGIKKARAARSVRRVEAPKDKEWLYDRIYGGWLGRCAGMALGKPVEAFMTPKDGLTSRGRIKAYLTGLSASEWPIKDYFPRESPGSAVSGKLGWSACSTREAMAFAENDDDLCYTAIGQEVLTRHGKKFTTRDVAGTWVSKLPYGVVCGAGTQTFKNLVTGVNFHQGRRDEVDWNWVSQNENPYREWICAQIRADPYGYVCPGDMELAAELAWRDGRLTSVKNGIYGAMFVAAMTAAAFVMDDPEAIVEAGLGEIPATSRLHKAVSDVVGICRKHGMAFDAFEAVFDEVDALLGHYSPAHTINNAGLVAAAVLLGGGDWVKTTTLSVMGGWDTDCNGATAGSIAGVMLGAGKLPQQWVGRLNDTLVVDVPGYSPVKISDCAKRSVTVAMK
jgi:ADP-ribosylglycohydrolase